MTDDPGLIAAIYEAAVLPERWPALLSRIAADMGAVGGNLIRSSDAGISVQSSPEVQEISVEFDRLGYNQQNTRVSRLLQRQPYPGFLTDSDLHSLDELERLPIYAEFLNPRGSAAGAATMIQGTRNDALIIAFEGFRDHLTSRETTSKLDALRPHLARAATLGAQLEMDRRRAMVAALEIAGVPAALLDEKGRIREANTGFLQIAGAHLIEGSAGGRPAELLYDRLTTAAIERAARGEGSSVPLRSANDDHIRVLHLLPISGEGRGLVGGISTVAIIADADNHRVPKADLLQALFDLTPAEARVARELGRGRSPAAIAAIVGNSVATVRSHAKQVFAKTGTTRQAELTALIGTLGAGAPN